MMNAVNNAAGAGYSSLPASTEPELIKAVGELGQLIDFLKELRADASGLADRLGGTVPEGVSPSVTREVFNDGLSGQLRTAIDSARDVAGDIRDSLTRLNRIG